MKFWHFKLRIWNVFVAASNTVSLYLFKSSQELRSNWSAWHTSCLVFTSMSPRNLEIIETAKNSAKLGLNLSCTSPIFREPNFRSESQKMHGRGRLTTLPLPASYWLKVPGGTERVVNLPLRSSFDCRIKIRGDRK